MRVRCLFAVGLLSIVPLSALADNWPQWRGPERTGVSEETGLLQQWPAEGPKLVWQVREIGQGYSTPAVVGDRLYLLSSDGRRSVRRTAVKSGRPASEASAIRTRIRAIPALAPLPRWTATSSMHWVPTEIWLALR
jgi:hypothetical protein